MRVTGSAQGSNEGHIHRVEHLEDRSTQENRATRLDHSRIGIEKCHEWPWQQKVDESHASHVQHGQQQPFVDALDGRPGLYSARFGTPDMDERDRRLLLLSEMQNVPADKRTARFICVIAVANPSKRTFTTTGTCEGHIAFQEDTVGKNGFGYDPVFIPESYDQTFASLPQEVKHRLSHRGRAAAEIVPILKQLAAQEDS